LTKSLISITNFSWSILENMLFQHQNHLFFLDSIFEMMVIVDAFYDGIDCTWRFVFN